MDALRAQGWSETTVTVITSPSLALAEEPPLLELKVTLRPGSVALSSIPVESETLLVEKLASPVLP